MKYLKNVFVGLMIVFALFTFSGCETGTDSKQAAKTETMMAEIDKQVGMPNILNFQQKKLMKTIYELNDKENLINYAYIKSDYHGKLMFIGKCIGYGIPFSAQYTNPSRIVTQRSGITLPQPDPNGLFMPTSSSATWLMMIDQNDEPRVVYLEPEIVVSPFPLHKE